MITEITTLMIGISFGVLFGLALFFVLASWLVAFTDKNKD